MGAIHTEYQRMNLEKLEQGKGNSGSKHLLSDTESLRRHQIFQEAVWEHRKRVIHLFEAA